MARIFTRFRSVSQLLHRGRSSFVVSVTTRFFEENRKSFRPLYHFDVCGSTAVVMPPKRKANNTKVKEQPASAGMIDENAGGDDPKTAKEQSKKQQTKEPVRKGRQAKVEAQGDKAEETNGVESSEEQRPKRGAKTNVEEAKADKVDEPKAKRGRGKKEDVEKDTEASEKPAKEEKEEPKPKRGGKNKKEQSSEEKDVVSEEAPEEKEVKPKRGARGKKEQQEEEVEEKEETGNTRKGRSAKKQASKAEEASEEEPKSKRAKGKQEKEPPKNQTKSDHDKIDFSCTRKNELGEEWNFKIASWNVAGLRGLHKKEGHKYFEYEKPDIICLQETKCTEDQLPDEVREVAKDYKQYWQSSEKAGYAGVVLFSKTEPLSVKYGIGLEEHDEEGRCITAEYEKFYVICVYVPNAGRKLVRLSDRLKWNAAFKDFVKELDEKKPVIICGDMNVAHNEIDLANPKTNTKNAGFTKEEREGMTELLSEGFVDTFRKLYPDKTGAYTFWSNMMNSRAKNVGWRLDYFIVSERFMEKVCDNIIRSEIYGSDHCPIALFLSV